MNKKDLMDAALYHHGEGRPVISVTRGKVPTVKGWDRWFREPQTEGEVRELFSNGAQGIGLLTFPATDLAALDFDGPHAAEAWAKTSIALPETARNFTRSGGHHLIFRIENGTTLNIGRKVRLAKVDCDCKDRDNGRPKPCGVDFLVNGFFIVPPTAGYSEDADAPFDHIEALPREVLELAEKSNSRKPTGQAASAKEKTIIPSGERNASLTSLAGAMRRRGASKESISAALKEENAAKCVPPLGNMEVRAIAESITHYEPRGGREDRAPLIVRVSEVRREEVSWLRPNRIPRKKITLVDGDPGEGKSFLTQNIAAGVSRGFGFPGEEETAPGGVILMSAEDGAEDTIRPRLEDMGADLERITLLRGLVDANGREVFLTLVDLDVIEKAIVQVSPALLIVDPIIAYTSNKDTHKAAEVRSLLAPLAALADKHNIAVVAVRHLNKGTGKSAYRGMGSIDFLAASRSAFLCGPDPANEKQKVFCHTKSNLGPIMSSLTYSIEGGRFLWGEKTNTTADQVLADSATAEERPRLEEAKAFLEEMLKSGPVPSTDIDAEARPLGISQRTIRRAKDALRVKARKKMETGEWICELPTKREN